ncbi:MAG: hypothetical protein K8S56_01310 [Candidatus Cloacimonetes bacterium]|nr:hypothetical protein [Candidatus Cloacimonadota bacterium]
MSIAEGVAGFYIGNKCNINPGVAKTIGVYGDFGMGLGLGTAFLTDYTDDWGSKSLSTCVLVGSGAGLFGGNLLTDNEFYTVGDAHVLYATGLLGAHLPLPILDAIGVKDEKTMVVASMLGSVAGLGLGRKIARKHDFTTVQGIKIRLSELVGACIGFGVASIISLDERVEGSSIFITSSSIGAAGAFWATYIMYAESAEIHEKNEKDFPLSIDIKPEGFLALAMKKNFAPNREITLPLLSLTYKF